MTTSRAWSFIPLKCGLPVGFGPMVLTFGPRTGVAPGSYEKWPRERGLEVRGGAQDRRGFGGLRTHVRRLRGHTTGGARDSDIDGHRIGAADDDGDARSGHGTALRAREGREGSPDLLLDERRRREECRREGRGCVPRREC